MQQSPFIPNQIYKRTLIHDEYGGNRQSGISPSATKPYIFIFSGKSGAQYGYRDGWDNKNIFSYTGEGQEGDMQFVKGNLALREHKERGKRIFLFESEGNSFVKFVSEMEFFDADFFETPDRNGVIRRGIKFFLNRVGVYLPVSPRQFELNAVHDDPINIYGNNDRYAGYMDDTITIPNSIIKLQEKLWKHLGELINHYSVIITHRKNLTEYLWFKYFIDNNLLFSKTPIGDIISSVIINI